jgi:hypothetical protein
MPAQQARMQLSINLMQTGQPLSSSFSYKAPFGFGLILSKIAASM